jgi:hypothetical protein
MKQVLAVEEGDDANFGGSHAHGFLQPVNGLDKKPEVKEITAPEALAGVSGSGQIDVPNMYPQSETSS